MNLVYWGVESGSDDVLAYVNKGCTNAEMEVAARILRRAGIDLSIMIMPGLGGMKYYRQHVEGTAALLGVIRPRFITFMGVNAAARSAYARKMQHEREADENRPLTPKETATQMADIIEQMPNFDTKVGCFDRRVDQVGCNPVIFGSRRLYFTSDKSQLVRELRHCVRHQMN
jgi:radical SAM superfamily enzyme YgiQ (UPF0313 family)